MPSAVHCLYSETGYGPVTDTFTGDVSGDGRADLVVGAGPGGGPNVRVFDGVTGAMIRDFQAFDASMNAGVQVTTAFVNDDQYADIVVGTGPGPTSQVKVFDGVTSTELAAPFSPYTPFGPTSTGGVSVAASNDPEGTYCTINPVPVSSIARTTMDKYKFTIKLHETDTSNGKQIPSGTITLKLGMYGTTLGTATLVPIITGAGIPGQAIATVVVPGSSFAVGTYSVQSGTPIVWTYSGSSDGWFMSSGQAYAPPLTVYNPGTVTGDLDILDSNGVVVAENKEENPGGWVPLNNDNDNYLFKNDPASNLVQLLDKEKLNSVLGENDLVKIWAHDLSAVNGTYSLNWDNSKLKLWNSADRNYPVPQGAVVPASGEYYWVEGLGLSSSMAAEQIQLFCQTTGNMNSPGPWVLDQVNFTVYEINGAMNVPGYSKYQYSAKIPGNSGFAPVFVSATDGVITPGAVVGGGASPITTSASVFWGAGAVVGTYRVSPDQGLLNFFVDRQVNVVKVEISAVGEKNNIQYPNPSTNPPKQSTGDERMIVSATIGDAMLATLRVEKIEGPVVNGGMRGVRFVEIGIIQEGYFEKMHGIYKGFGQAVGEKRRVSTLEGKTHLDVSTLEPVNSSIPWYDSLGQTIEDPELIGRGLFPTESAAPSDALFTNIDFAVADRPQLWGTDLMGKSYFGQGGVADDVDRYEILFRCKNYLAVRTKDASNGSEAVFTQRAGTPNGWYFNGSGDVVAGKWKGDVFDDLVNMLQVPLSKVDGDKSFAVITNGSVVPLTVVPTINSKLIGDTMWGWS